MIDPLQGMVDEAFAALGGLVARSNRLPADAHLSKAEWIERPWRETDPTITTPVEETSFGIATVTDNSVTFYKGALRVLGLESWTLTALSDLTVLITSFDIAHPTWVYLQRNKSSGAVTLECTDAEGGPQDTSEVWTFPLYTMYVNGAGKATLAHDWRHDVRMGTPVG